MKNPHSSNCAVNVAILSGDSVKWPSPTLTVRVSGLLIELRSLFYFFLPLSKQKFH